MSKSDIKSIYLIGSLKNREIIELTKEIEETLKIEVFSDWLCPGPEADDFLRDYYRARGYNYRQILKSHAVQNIFEFDKKHIDRCDAVMLVMPGGKSGHLELGYAIGKGKPGFILFDEEPDRVDVMHAFATEIFLSRQEFYDHFK